MPPPSDFKNMTQNLTNTENSEFIIKISAIFLQYQTLLQTIDLLVFTKKEHHQSSIGAHTRHVIDRINCLLNGFESGEVDYDKRARDTQLEEDPKLCCALFDQLSSQLTAIFCDPQKKLQVLETISEDGYKINVSSTLEREMLDIVSHLLHHLASIKFILERNNISVADSIGKNPSTIIHEKQ